MIKVRRYDRKINFAVLAQQFAMDFQGRAIKIDDGDFLCRDGFFKQCDVIDAFSCDQNKVSFAEKTLRKFAPSEMSPAATGREQADFCALLLQRLGERINL